MKSCIVLFVLVSVAFVAAQYSSKYDNVDIDRILGNNRILTNYLKCLLEEGSCTGDARELKKVLPDALATGCSKCNDKQKQNAEKVINHVRTKRPQDWERLLKKYDPQGEYQKRYEAQQSKKA